MKPVSALGTTVRTRSLAVLALALGPACADVVVDPHIALEPIEYDVPSDPMLTVTASPACPLTIERTPDGTTCADTNLTCEYGASAEPVCNVVVDCQNNGARSTWQRRQRRECRLPTCPAPEAMRALDGAPCAAAPDGPVTASTDGGTPADDAATLAMSGGTAPSDEVVCPGIEGVCTCTTGRDAAHVHDRRWVCTHVAAPCPFERPRIGQPCAVNVTCDYGVCTSKRGLGMTCAAGVWTTASIACE